MWLFLAVPRNSWLNTWEQYMMAQASCLLCMCSNLLSYLYGPYLLFVDFILELFGGLRTYLAVLKAPC